MRPAPTRLGAWLLVALTSGGMLAACERTSDSGARASAGAPASSASVGAPSPPASSAATADELETVDDEPEIVESEIVESEGDGRGACEPADPGAKPVQLLRFAFASAVERKDPRDRLSIARPGQRIYSHLTLRNRSGRERCVTIELSVGNARRTTLVQKVGRSWSWRTWVYNTLRDDDRGELEAVIRDDQGNELARRELVIVPER
ncbi:MAG: hypothetical protein FJ095_07745 [Deltaproteobacteria bacterium]|nr:hypothetical protein [Deltaproteobacteria bacterium]